MSAFSPELTAAAILLLAIVLGALTYAGANRAAPRIAERALAQARAIRRHGPDQTEAATPFPVRLMRALARLADHIPLFDAKQRRQFALKLHTAGLRHPLAPQVFIALKIAAGLTGAMLGLVGARLLPAGLDGGMMPLIGSSGGLVLGLLGPDMLLEAAVNRRRRAIHRALPDTLDLMVICTNAGFSLATTLRRLSVETRSLSPALANELAATADDIHLHADPLVALRHLSERTGVRSLHAVVTTLIQSQRYGTPITQSLKTLAQVERRARILAMEEKGAKLSAKITIPMMLLILPAVLLLAGAPAFLRIMETFGK
jgi:tight adherence protein C